MAPTPTKSRLWRSFVAPATTKKRTVAHASVGTLPREWPATPDAYVLLGQIGKGAAAVVFRARCIPLDAIVAVRKLSLDGTTDDLGGLVREATMMRRFNHPAVLPLHAAFVAARELWMVTPLMDQGSVRSIMVRHFPQGLEEVVIASIMKVVLLGLSYVHKQGGIHRDIKADNILISEAGQVCLGDFGVSSATQSSLHCATSTGSAADLRAHTFVGTPCWMAPEVIQQLDGGYGCGADVWSIGITMLELAHGQPPMAKMHPMRIVMGTLQNPPPSLEDHPTGRKFSKAMRAVVDACLHKDPHERPTAEELLHFKFFRSAKGSAFLARHFLAGLPLPEATRVATSARLRRAASNKLKDLLNPFGSGRHASAWFFPPLDVPEETQEQEQQQDDTQPDPYSDQQQAAVKQGTACAGPGPAAGAPVLVAAAAAAGSSTDDAAAEEALSTVDGAGQEPPAALQLEQPPPPQQQEQEQQFASPFQAAAQQPPHPSEQQQDDIPVVNLLQPGSGSAFQAVGSSKRHHKPLFPAWMSGRGSGSGFGTGSGGGVSSGSASSGGGRGTENPIAALRAFVRARRERRAAAEADVAVFAAKPRIAAARSG